MTSWFDGVAYCVGDQAALEMVEFAHSSGIVGIGERLNLSIPEILTIHSYTSQRKGEHIVFEAVNSILRRPGENRPLEEALAEFIEILRTGLEKLPPVHGVVYRRADLPQRMLEDAMEGRLSDAGFLSSSERADLFWGKDLMVIRSSFGRSVSSLSLFPSEQEVLFLPRTRFEVSRLERNENGAILLMHEAKNDR